MEFLILILLLVVLCKVDHITSTNTHKDRHPGLLFDNHPGNILSLPANMTKVKQMSTKVSSKMDCVFACVEKPWCRSVNFKIIAEKDGRHNCELIGTDNYTNPKHLKPDEKYTHLSIKNPCEAKPCLNKEECLPHENRLDYRCRCKDGYTGEKCQHDVDECAAKPCDANAACNNTEGSYRCTCNVGYHGNGKQCTPYVLRGLGNSTILRYYGNDSYFQRLSSYLDPVLQSSSRSRLVRCWHAATDGWDVTTTFHPQCDGKGPTVTIVRVGSYVFGGYTDVSWHSSGDYSNSNRSFLYSLYNTQGYNPVKLTFNKQLYYYYAIKGASNFGPTFGAGYDLVIYNYASSNTNSYANLGHTYQTPPICSRTCKSFLAGSYNFSPNDIEVFYETTN